MVLDRFRDLLSRSNSSTVSKAYSDEQMVERYDVEHYRDAKPLIEELEEAGASDELERVLWWAVEEVESGDERGDWGVGPFYYERLAEFYRDRGEIERERAVLDRYEAQRYEPGTKHAAMLERLERLREEGPEAAES